MILKAEGRPARPPFRFETGRVAYLDFQRHSRPTASPGSGLARRCSAVAPGIECRGEESLTCPPIPAGSESSQ